MTAEPVSFVPEFVTPEPGEPDSLNALFRCLAETTDNLDTESKLHLEMFDDAPAAALLLHSLRQARKRLHELEAAVEATTAQRMNARVLPFPGWTVERKGGQANVKWDHEALARKVLERLAVDTATGEVNPEVAQILSLARQEMLACCSPSYWRVGEVQARDIDPYEYRTSEKGRYSITVTPAQDRDAP